MTELEQVLQEYISLGINQQLDYDKFYLYSIITHSTAIEGSTVTEVEAQLLFDEGITSSKRTMVEQMMNLDLKAAYEFGIKWIKQHPEITVDSLITLSSKVMEHTGSEYHTIVGDFSAAKGELRKVNVTAGIGGASYMPYQKVPEKLESFCQELNQRRKNLNQKDTLSVYNLSFWAHYELVTIHPWADGNGRMSRLLMNLIQWEFNIIPSKVLKEDKAEYIQALVDSREKDDFVIFTDCMINLHTRHIKEEITNYNASINEGGQKIDVGGQKKWSETTQKVYALIKENPSISRKELSETLSINPSAVQKHIEKLKKEGVIIRKNGAKGGHWEVK